MMLEKSELFLGKLNKRDDKMKIVQINTFSYKATGHIMMQIHETLQKEGIDSYVVWGRGRKPINQYEFSIEDRIGIALHGAISRGFDLAGLGSWRATKKLIYFLEKVKPDIIHLHNIHGYYINIMMLFKYLNLHSEIKIVWTIHDCWPFTGHCAYFTEVGCDKWKTGCEHCVQKTTYPKSIGFDMSKWNWNKKKELFTQRSIQLVTPSNWLKTVVEESFLNNNRLEVIYNGLDMEIFKPTAVSLKSKKYILGVASEWTERKGLNDFINLRKFLDNSYDIVLIGLNQGQIDILPKGIVGIKRTESVEILAEYYSNATVFVNMSVEETMGMTTVEALSCGTPVIVYCATALPEIVDEDSGIIVNSIHDVRAVADAIYKIERGSYNNCRDAAKKYEKSQQFMKYVKLYKRMYGE